MQRFIDLIGITKVFGRTTVLDSVDLYISKNEFLTLLGPSGCGKTTTLRIIGGFERPTAGELLFRGESLLPVPPHKRKVNTVFQKYALFPNMNVADNVAFGLAIKKVPKKTADEKVVKILKLVNLDGFGRRPVASLSGGQQQRVAIARALVNEPEVLLLDEPLGALDLKLRKEMQLELKKMQQSIGITFVYVTHDQEEALTMSDTIAVMNAGRLLQIGKPEDIYNEPRNSFVANFIGESNVLPGTATEDFYVRFAGHTFKCVDKGFARGEDVEVVVRPEDLAIVPVPEGALTGTVRDVTFKGVHYEMLIEPSLTDDGGEIPQGFVWKAHSTVMSPRGASVGLRIEPDLIHVMRKDARDA